MTQPRSAALRQGRSGSGGAGQWPMAERSIIATVLGVPPLAALGLAVGLTAIGVLIDVLRIGTVGIVFKVGYFAGCVLAVAWVRRRSLFTPIVQPPLLVAVIVPVLVLVVGSPRAGSGTAEKLLLIGAPLINAFPTMATTTAVVVGLGIGRILLQRNDDGPRLGRLTGDRPGAGRAAAGSGRTGSGRTGSPRGGSTRTGSGRGSSEPRGSTGTSGSGSAGRSAGSARDTGARDTGSRDTGAHDAGPRDRRPGGAARALDDLREEPADRRPSESRPSESRLSERRGPGAARGAARTSRSPRRS